MKKLLSVVLILCLLIPAAIAEAPVDVKSLTDDELKALYKDVKAELMERKLWDSSIIPAGLYQAGKSIPEGLYECVSKKDSTYVYVYTSYEKFLKNDWSKKMTPDEGESFTISLYGDVCYFIDEECTIRPFTGFSW